MKKVKYKLFTFYLTQEIEPDSLMQYDYFRKLFPNTKLYPIEEQISTAKKNEYLEVVGRPTEKIQFIFNQQFSYSTRPMVAKKLLLPCLFSHYDMQMLKLKINYQTGDVLIGESKVKSKLTTYPKNNNSEVTVNLLHNEVIQPQEEAIIPVHLENQIGTNCHILIQPSSEFQDNHLLCVAASLDQSRKSLTSHVRVMNMNNHPINLKAGTPVGIATAVQQVSTPKEKMSWNKKEFLKKVGTDLKLYENTYLTFQQKEELLELLFEYQDVVSK